MVKLKSLKPHTFNNKTIEKDEEFEADEAYATSLVSLGRAVRVDEGGEASTATGVTGTGSTDKSGAYQTRDMKAGDTTGAKMAEDTNKAPAGGGASSAAASGQPSTPTGDQSTAAATGTAPSQSAPSPANPSTPANPAPASPSPAPTPAKPTGTASSKK